MCYGIKKTMQSPILTYQSDHIYLLQRIGHGMLKVTGCHRIVNVTVNDVLQEPAADAS